LLPGSAHYSSLLSGNSLLFPTLRGGSLSADDCSQLRNSSIDRFDTDYCHCLGKLGIPYRYTGLCPFYRNLSKISL